MSMNEIHNQKILEFIQSNKCDLSNAFISELDTNILNFKNTEELILSENLLVTLSIFLSSKSSKDILFY